MRVRYHTCPLILAAFFSLFAPLRAAADKDVDAIFAAWKQRQQVFETVRCTISGTVEFKYKSLPPGDPVRPKRFTVLLDLKRHRFRIESLEDWPGGDKMDRWDTTEALRTHDGKETRYFQKRPTYPPDTPQRMLGVRKGNQVFNQLDGTLVPLFYGLGVVPHAYGEFRPDKWAVDFDPENFEYRGRQSIGGKTHDVIRTMPRPSALTMFDEFWVDRQHLGAIIYWAEFHGKYPSPRVDVEWGPLASAWLPKKWTYTIGSAGASIHWIGQLRVDAFEPNVPVSDSDFTIPAEPGMTVHEQIDPAAGSGLNPMKPAQRVYKVLPSGTWELVSETGFTTFDGKPVALPSRWRAWRVWVGVGLAVLVIAGGVIFWRVRARRRSALA